MPKNSTTPKAAPARKRPAQDSAAVIAGHISAILNHPDTPVRIYDALREAMNDLDEPRGHYNRVEHIAPLIANNIRKGGES